jgi:hypothetical protein
LKDTPDEVTELQRRLLRERSPGERLAMVSDMFEFARELALAGLRDQGVTCPVELQVGLFLRLHGQAFTPEARAKVVEWIRAQAAPEGSS